MSQIDTADRTESESSAYVPTLQLTEGQPAPIAANGGLSYMSFDKNGDAGTAEALKDVFALIEEGAGVRMNIGIADLEIVREETKWVTGLSRESGSSGEPGNIDARLPGMIDGDLPSLAVCGAPTIRRQDRRLCLRVSNTPSPRSATASSWVTSGGTPRASRSSSTGAAFGRSRLLYCTT